nr:hypothetical protein [uncultured Cohaesibacter sp.]
MQIQRSLQKLSLAFLIQQEERMKAFGFFGIMFRKQPDRVGIMVGHFQNDVRSGKRADGCFCLNQEPGDIHQVDMIGHLHSGQRPLKCMLIH